MTKRNVQDNRENTEDALLLSNQLCFALHSCSLELTKLYRPLLAPLQLTYPQYLVMLVLWERKSVQVKELGIELHLDSGTLTPLLKNLERAGLVHRERNPSDERSVIISLTRKGAGLRDKARGIPDELGCGLGLSASRVDSLLREITALRNHIREHRLQG
jgi:MarR family transcriptional regulator, organic hydroperoxide resistance regulator